MTVDFVDTLAVLWISAAYFRTVICLGSDNCKTMWLNIEVSWDVTACRRGNCHFRPTAAVLNLQRCDAVRILDNGSCTI